MQNWVFIHFMVKFMKEYTFFLVLYTSANKLKKHDLKTANFLVLKASKQAEKALILLVFSVFLNQLASFM